MELDLIDINQICADCLSHQDTVAGDTGRTGRNRTLQVVTIFHDHVFVVPETACRKYDRIRIDRVEGRRALGLDADHCAFQSDQVRRLGVIHDIHVKLIQFLQESRHKICADARAVFGRMDTRIGCTAREGHLRKRCSDGIKPVDPFCGILSHGGDKVYVIDVVAALHRVFDKLFDAVLNALLSLIMSFSRIHAAGCFRRISSGIRHLLKKDYVFTALCCLDCSSHAGAAGTYDHDISRKILILHEFRLSILRLRESIQVCTGLGQRILKCPDDRLAGHRRSGKCIHIRALGFQNPVAEHIYREGSDVFRFVIACDLNVCDLVFRDRHGYIDIPAETGGRCGIGSRDEFLSVRCFCSPAFFIAVRLCIGRACTTGSLCQCIREGCLYSPAR